MPDALPSLVSTIIPVFNRPRLLERAVGSVLAQTYRPIEILIVNDGSTDETPDVADRLCAQLPDAMRAIHLANGGPGLAREAGRRAAGGEFVQYLDSDDILLPRKFELQVQALREHPECGVAYCQTAYVDEVAGRTLCPWKRTGERISQMFPSLAADRWWGTSTPLYRRTVTDAAGAWSHLTNCEDWEYDCRIATQGVSLAYVPEALSEEHGHPGPRLSESGATDPAKLRARAEAHILIAGHLTQAGLADSLPEVRFYGSLSFLLARQCGAAGLARESRLLLDTVCHLCPNTVAALWKFRLYAWLGTVLGWSTVGRLACWRDRVSCRREAR